MSTTGDRADGPGDAPVLTPAQMGRADRWAIEHHGIPGPALMESAGAEVARTCMADVEPGRAFVLCGRGNNGGDGFVVARRLASAGWEVVVAFVGSLDDLDPGSDAATMLRPLWEMGVCPVEIVSGEEWQTLGPEQDRAREAGEPPPRGRPAAPAGEVALAAARCDLVVDALLGTGLSGDVRGVIAELITAFERAKQARRDDGEPVCRTVAVDIPSGISGETGEVLGCAVRADATVTMAALKVGLTTGAGPDHAGDVTVADIGIPSSLLRDPPEEDPPAAGAPEDA